MRRLFVWFGLALWILTPSAGTGQTVDPRMENATADIALLKRIVAEQDRRITSLEAALKAGQGIRIETNNVVTRPQISSIEGWKKSGNWARVKDGMSSTQAASVLGKPTSSQSVGGFQTLFYQGEVSGSGVVTGTVKLQDDRVWQVNTPVF